MPGHAAPTSRHRPVPQPAPQPSQQLPQPPSQQLPPQALQATQRAMPPVSPPERRDRRQETRAQLPQPSQQMPQPSQQLPKPAPRPQPQPPQQSPQSSGGWPAPPPPEPTGLAARLDGRQESRPDLRPVTPPPSPMQEGMTEQIPRVTDEPPPGSGMRTGQHPAPHRVARSARGPQPSMPLPQPPPAFPQHEPDEDDNYPTEYHGFEPVQAEIPERTQFVEGIELDDDEYGQEYEPRRSVEHDRPIGVDDDYDDEDEDQDGKPRSSPVREWLSMAGQLAIGVIGGAALWLGFNWLWGKLPTAALVVALVVTVGMVWVVRKIRHQEDLWTTIITMVVSLVITMSPVLLSR
jgi:hypothetical protein